MEAPKVARRQNTFLAPIWLSLLGFAVLAVASFALYARLTTTTVILVRHAEKQLGTIADPPLTQEGDERAQRLARLFGEHAALGSVQAIYATSTRRAQATAAPLAARLGLQVITADDAPAALARRVRREQHGGVALIVGHSNTIPGWSRRSRPAPTCRDGGRVRHDLCRQRARRRPGLGVDAGLLTAGCRPVRAVWRPVRWPSR
ncbi:MAG: histidine phosphatase family protein [Anaerolineae bacterium]|nr:histidine phosphatase family protein [Anaerolineae bacterium]